MSIEIVEGAEAQANIASQPANVLLYSGPGMLKTTDAVTAFTHDGKCSAFAIPFEDGALKIIAARGLPVPAHPKQTVKTWAQLVDTIGWLAQNKGRFNAVILDGFSPLTANLYRAAEEQYKGSNKFQIPVAVRNAVFTLRDWIRTLGLHSVFIAHALPPAVQDGQFYPGCFEVAPKSISRILFGQLDTVLRVDYITPMPGQPRVRCYYTGGQEIPAGLGPLALPPDHTAWLVKNREGCNQAVVPADLGAFLRSRRPAYQGL